MNKIKSFGPKGSRYPTKSPFILIGYHKDDYPKGNDKMEPTYYIDGRDVGQDFNPSSPWRMYHGDKIPGFPVHPHRGFETVTIVEEGVIDHTDSFGGNGRYADGDVQWLTAGSGVQHCEMFPLVNNDKENPFEIFQIWLNLSKKNKMVTPHYKMLWKEDIPVYTEENTNGSKVKIKVIHGSYKDISFYNSTPDSWAADKSNDVRILLIEMDPHAELNLSTDSKTASRMLYYYKGSGITLEDVKLTHEQMYAELKEGESIHIKNGNSPSKLLLLEGNEIKEPIALYGPFVMNTEQEIVQAMNDYRRTEFGGWKWDEPGPVHDRNKGRYAEYSNGEMHYPNENNK
ncbi:pirin family protein [Peptostreptococcus faecalis]|uniref:pirin family protein n=1 Tax=Peptostreptococcus faecalis TaxID=2045015 RepID=UPI000C7980F1|nr:pirin family protein [Peptostreptococcus faecalis]